MKILKLLTLLSFLLSTTIVGQVSLEQRCTGDDIKIKISSVTWNGGSLSQDDIFLNNGAIPSGFHMIDLSFSGGKEFITNDYWYQDVSLVITQRKDEKTVMFRYPNVFTSYSGYEISVSPRYDNNQNLIGFRFSPTAGGGGVATVAGIAARTRLGEPTRPCIELTRQNVSLISNLQDLSNGGCTLPNPIVIVKCRRSTGNFESDMDREGQITDFSIYPNPAANTLFVKNNNGDNGDIQKIEVFNLFGQSVTDKTSTRYGQSELQINTTQLDAGIYMIEISTTSGEKVTSKIMVQR